MFFDVVFRETDQVWGVDQSYLHRLFFRLLSRKGREQRSYQDTMHNDNHSGLVNLSNFFSDFIREREMLYGAKPATIRFYHKGWLAFERQGLPTTLETIRNAIVAMRESGLGVGGANNYIRAWQVFCNWLADRGHIDRFCIPLIPQQKTRKPVFDQGQAIAVIRCKPKPPSVRRAQAMFALMLDTAIRFGECVSIFRSDIDARSGLITVRGKTGERSVPISIEGLRVLQRHLSKLFTLAKAPVELAEWHNVRRFALRSYLASGAGIRGAQLLAGHQSQSTTEIYLSSDEERARLPHNQLSPLARLSGQRR